MNDDNPSGKTASGETREVSHPSGQVPDIYGALNKSLITLAVKCRLITRDQEAVLLDTLARKRKDLPGYSAVLLFEETGVLSETEIQFLFAVRDHLEMKMMDKKFGELGVANRLVDPENVQKALDIQNRVFKETNQSRLIGDILLENNQITRANKAAILLTQDRIKDELLAEAMNDIAESELEKFTLNMRFGAIAVKKNFVSLDQLNRALALQESEVKAGSPRRYLGTILKELFDLPEDQLNHVLMIQKELEKKRLSLEKALEDYNTETKLNKRLARLFEYRFSKNRLEARLVRVRRGFENIRPADVKQWLSSMGIVYGICPDKDISRFLDKNVQGDELLIARGEAPTPGRDGGLEFFFDMEAAADPPEGGDREPVFVKKGDTLARRIPSSAGRPGRDVSGFTIKVPPPAEPLLNCGEGVIRDKDLYLADMDGIPILYKNRTLLVREEKESVPTRHHTGHLDGDMEDTYARFDLRVEGDILAGGKVWCRNLTVSGRILGQVSAGGHVRVKGGIGGAEDTPAIVMAEGEVQVGGEISNAVVVTAKSLKAPGADLTAAAVQAFEDIIVKNVLKGPRPCMLQAGAVPSLKTGQLSGQIRSCQKTLDRLSCTSDIRELDEWLAQRMEIKENFLAQHEFLKYLLALMAFSPLADLPGLEEKIAAADRNREKWPDLPAGPECRLEAFVAFRAEVMERAGSLAPDALTAYLKEQADIKHGMYRAAVSASRRYQHEYDSRLEMIQEKVNENRIQIEKIKAEIRNLTVRQDAFLSRRASAQSGNSSVRVKNKVAGGTVVKGKKAVLTVDRDIFGVKFSESPRTREAPAAIHVDGFYD